MTCSLALVRIALLAELLVPAGPGQQAALFDELAEIYPDSELAAGSPRFRGDTPTGVPAGVQVLVTALPPGAPVRWRLTEGESQVKEARAFRLIDVPVEQNTGLRSRTELWDGKRNPHVIRRAPFRVFEVMQPIGDEARAGPEGILALRLEASIPAEAKPGLRLWQVSLESDSWRQTLSWELRVHPVAVPPSGPQSPAYTNWFHPGIMAARHGIPVWSEEFWRLLGGYADIMARGRQNTFWVRWRDFLEVGPENQVRVDRIRLQRYVDVFLERGFCHLESGHLAGRHGGDWSSPRLDLQISGSDVQSPQGKRELRALLTAIQAALRSLRLPAHVSTFQHLADEPTDTNAASYRVLAEEVRRHLPGVPILEATMSQSLAGAVDVWCPQIQEYQKHRAFFDERRQAGDRVWIYTCLAPGGPWLNRLLDQERLRPVYLGWALVKEDLSGFLHWGLNHYRHGVDPFQQSVVPHGKDSPRNFLPAGDSHVVYPGPDGPLSGQRFEAHRIGMEDAELLRLLKSKDLPLLQEIMERVLPAFDDFETALTVYRQTRGRLLTALGVE